MTTALRDLIHAQWDGTMTDLAARVGVHFTTLYRWMENGHVTARHIRPLAGALGVSPDRIPGPNDLTVAPTFWPRLDEVGPDWWAPAGMAVIGGEPAMILGGTGLYPIESAPLFPEAVRAARAYGTSQVRVLLGDPDSAHGRHRTTEECGDPEVWQQRALHSLRLWVTALGGADSIRTYHRPVEMSLYQVGASALRITHLYGHDGTDSPVEAIVPEHPLWGPLTAHAEAVWEAATPFDPDRLEPQ